MGAVEEDFTVEEADSTAAVVFMAEGLGAGAFFTAVEVFAEVGSAVVEVSEGEVSAAAFTAVPAFAEEASVVARSMMETRSVEDVAFAGERSGEVFVATVFDMAGDGADADGVGEVGAGVGA